jgi:hypothetical protein
MSSAGAAVSPAALSNMTLLMTAPPTPGPDEVEEEEVERTATGIPIDLIWLPYVALSLVLLGLMGLSFLHYHRKNGHKYRRRRAEILKQFNMQDILHEFQSSPPNGGFTISSGGGEAEQPYTPPQPARNPYHHRSPKQNPHFQSGGGASAGGGGGSVGSSSNKNTNEDLYPTRRKQTSDSAPAAAPAEPLQKQPSILRQLSSTSSSRRDSQPAYSPRGVPLVTAAAATTKKQTTPPPVVAESPPPNAPLAQPSTSTYTYQAYCETQRGGGSGKAGGVIIEENVPLVNNHNKRRSRTSFSEQRPSSGGGNSGDSGTSSGHSRRDREHQHRGHKRPLEFTSNLNGSMVDIRCGVPDSHRTFRRPPQQLTKNTRSTSLPTSSIWTLPNLSAASRGRRGNHAGGSYHGYHGGHHYGNHQHHQPPHHQHSAHHNPYAGYPMAAGRDYFPEEEEDIHHWDYGDPRGPPHPPPGGRPYSPGGPLHSIMSDGEDDETFLLHQTKL